MWSRNELTRKLSIEWPILQAPMAGGISTPALAAAVADAGGLGAFAVGGLAPDAVRDGIRAIRRLTSRPFAVNFFTPGPAPGAPTDRDLAAAEGALRLFREQVGLGAPAHPALPPRLEDQLDGALAEGFPIFSFTFGIPAPAILDRLRAKGIVLLGTATTPGEAAALQAAGVDVVVAQGSEAGGHRGTFGSDPGRALIGTLALVPRVVDRVALPVVAAGGISDGRGLAAALALGAKAVQVGSAFLACAESGAAPAYRAAAAGGCDDDRTALTTAFSGRMARGIRNRFVEGMADRPVLPFPFQNALTQDMRAAAARAGDAGLLSLWAGQGPPPRSGVRAADVVAAMVREAGAVLDALR
jgi:nitronate monooxygenase